MSTPDPYELVGEHFPLDGPYSPDMLAAALGAASGLVRYSNHATLSAKSGALPSPADGYSAVGALSGLVGGLPQLLEQLSAWASGLADDLGLRPREDRAAARVTADDAAHSLHLATVAARALYEEIGRAQQKLSHLYTTTGLTYR